MIGFLFPVMPARAFWHAATIIWRAATIISVARIEALRNSASRQTTNTATPMRPRYFPESGSIF